MLEVLTSMVITILKIPNMYGLVDIVYIQIMCSLLWTLSFWLDNYLFIYLFFVWIRHHMNLGLYIYAV